MDSLRCAQAIFSAATLAGCVGYAPAPSPADDPAQAGFQVKHDAPDGGEVLTAPAEQWEHASAGWLELEGSPLHPWCAAVLVAPDVVLTTAACASTGLGALRFGVGVPGGPSTPVSERRVLTSSPHLVALRLATAQSVPPAIARSAPLKDGARVQGVALGFAPIDQDSDRWTWMGHVRNKAHELRVDVADAESQQQGAPNCHGDSGAGVFTDDGKLAGIVVGASSAGSTCVNYVTLDATPGDYGEPSSVVAEAVSLSLADPPAVL